MGDHNGVAQKITLDLSSLSFATLHASYRRKDSLLRSICQQLEYSIAGAIKADDVAKRRPNDAA
jgi:hypothetical protein